ncbi:MAG TPA: lytic transglycosylase domain-containing protein [Desulfosarcina sp.]|nr:lytic transglycosylase domain-containing protein [Desulfosarcina sp.]
MIPKTRMTIDMYLRQAGIRTDRPVAPGTADAPFSEILQSIKSRQTQATGSAAAGATLADYRNHRHLQPTSADVGRSTLYDDSLARRIPRQFEVLHRHPLPRPAADAEPAAAAMARNDPPGRPEDQKAVVHRGIRQAARKYGLPEKLIESVIRAESDFQADAVSPAGARGLMQLMPATARELGVTDPFDVQQNIDGGAKYLRRMLDRFDGDLKLALAAYNAGPGTVARYDGDVPYRETRDYVRRVLAGMGKADPA